MIDLFIVGMNHVTAPVQVREKFALDETSQIKFLSSLSDAVDEVVFLSTCNRTEIIYRPRENSAIDEVKKSLCEFGRITRDQFNHYFYIHRKKKALTHLFSVASGIDSMIPGETQILGQIKNAFDFSSKHGFTKGDFQYIYQKMLNTAKSVRNETKLGHGGVSVGSAAVRLARNIFETLEDKAILLIGAGEMCEIASQHFIQSGVRTLHVINRTKEKADKLAEQYGGVAHDMSELEVLMENVDIILSSTSSNQCIITRKITEKSREHRRGRPLFIIDIAVPRNVEYSVNKVADIYLYNIDDLKKLVASNLTQRQKEIATAEKLVNAKVDDYYHDDGKLAGTLIQSLQQRAEAVRESELNRLFRRKDHFTTEDQNEIQKTANLIINKILHDPIISLRRDLKKHQSGHFKIVRRFKDFFNL